MGKPLIMERGKRYLIARCPDTQEMLDAIPDPGAMPSPAGTGQWIVDCEKCGSHAFDLETLKPEVWTAPIADDPHQAKN